MNSIVGHSVLDLHGPDIFYGGLKKSLDISLVKGLSTRTEFSRPGPDGKLHWIRGQHNPYFDPSGTLLGVVVSAIDITHLKETQLALANSQNRLQSIYDDTPSMFFSVNRQLKITSVNAYVESELGYEKSKLIGLAVIELFIEKDKSIAKAHMEACFKEPQKVKSWELQKVNIQGNSLWVKETARVVSGELDGHQHLFIVSEDISERQKLSKRLSYQASHDYLTDLLNRQEFECLLQGLLNAKSVAKHCEHILCYLDLGQFKVINDSCGHLAGDLLLKDVSKILLQSIRQRDIVARVGGDEFAIVMEFCPLDKALSIAKEIISKIENYRFLWDAKSYSIGVSIGLVVIDVEVDTLNKVMAFADQACYVAKVAGGNQVQLHLESNLDIHKRREEMSWVNRIKTALDENKFCLYAQKIVAVEEMEAYPPSYEILLRLRDQGQLISPDVFLRAAERYHLATKIDQWVVLNAFEWLASLKDQIDNINYCTINLSGISLSDSQFLKFVLKQMNNFQIQGRSVCFEITETAAISNFNGVIKFIQQCQKLGCRFALDDFGSGVSSFGYLKKLHVDIVKIDGSFIHDIDSNAVNFAMVKSINDIAHVMGIQTVAEYVESAAALSCLKKLGVDFVQGYLIGKPNIIAKNHLPTDL